MWKWLLVLSTILVLVIASEMLGITWSRDKLFTACQPQEIDYRSYGPYCFHVIKMNRLLGHQKKIIISKTAETDYGHVLNFPTDHVFDRSEWEKLRVDWRPEGLEFETALKVRVFIPKENFLGGR
ncbi:MAG: hypothetical protein U1E10_06240 [Bdellovibrionales bacterium]|nr:hypothetical protein [Bdellovibrionales bacterium]